jgi:hypothetical protein
LLPHRRTRHRDTPGYKAALTSIVAVNPIEAEHLGLSLKETPLKDPIKRAVPLHQLGGTF